MDHGQQVSEGAERTVWKSRDNERVFKVMKPWLLERPTMGGYLERLRLSNETFGDDLRLEGAVLQNGKVLAVIPQPFRAGEHPGMGAIREWMMEGGFEPMNVAQIWKRPMDGLTVSDATPDNFIESPAGEMIPIDAQIFRTP